MQWSDTIDVGLAKMQEMKRVHGSYEKIGNNKDKDFASCSEVTGWKGK